MNNKKPVEKKKYFGFGKNERIVLTCMSIIIIVLQLYSSIRDLEYSIINLSVIAVMIYFLTRLWKTK